MGLGSAEREATAILNEIANYVVLNAEAERNILDKIEVFGNVRFEDGYDDGERDGWNSGYHEGMMECDHGYA